MLQAAIRAPEGNPAGLAFLYRRQFELCKVQRGETIALVSDLTTRREYIQAAFAAADELGADVYEMCVNAVPSWTKVGVPTIGKCKGTLEAVRAADIIVIFHVPLFTKWLKEVMEHEVLSAYDHRHLNLEVPEFARAVPTTENIAIAAWRRIEPALKTARGARLTRVRIYETPEIFAEFRGES